MKKRFEEIVKIVDQPNYKVKGTYNEDDCIFLLKDVTSEVKEITVEEKEQLIASGVNYSEMLSKEAPIKDSYNELFLNLLEKSKEDLAKYIGILSETIYEDKGNDLVIVSLARAGSPFGILIKRYLKEMYNVNIPHYSVSIIREKGIDENSLIYILGKHPNAKIQFVDGWTGKGSISNELVKSIGEFNSKYNTNIDNSLAVLADPSKICKYCGTRKDIIIPNCCLNSTVSGLISRTYHNKELIGENDFHGAKVFWDLPNDYSNYFIDEITKLFSIIGKQPVVRNEVEFNYGEVITNQIANEFDVKDKKKIKLSIGESSRVVIRRIPRLLLIKDLTNPHLAHILEIAKDKQIPIIIYDKSDYECISIIKE